MYLWLETTFETVQKWSLRPLLDSPKGGLNIGILLFFWSELHCSNNFYDIPILSIYGVFILHKISAVPIPICNWASHEQIVSFRIVRSLIRLWIARQVHLCTCSMKSRNVLTSSGEEFYTYQNYSLNFCVSLNMFICLLYAKGLGYEFHILSYTLFVFIFPDEVAFAACTCEQ